MLNYTGDVPEELWAVLLHAWRRPLALQSDFARQNSVGVALAASMGLLSSIKPDGTEYTTCWHVTAAGITALHYKEHIK